MTRAAWIGIGLLLALLWGSRFVVDPRPRRGPADAAAEKQRGDEAFGARDWRRAGHHYRAAFALESPGDPDRVPHRAFLAHQAAAAYVRIVTAETAEVPLDDRREAKDLATLWLGEARALDPDRGWVLYEQAVLLDRAPETLRDPRGARDAYAAFVAWAEDAGTPGADKPDADHPALALARERVAVLSG